MEATSPGQRNANIGFTGFDAELYGQAGLFVGEGTSSLSVGPTTISSHPMSFNMSNSVGHASGSQTFVFDSKRFSAFICPINNSCLEKQANNSLGLGGEAEGHIWDNLWRVIPLGIVLALLCLLTTAGNIMVLHAVRTEKRLQTVSTCPFLYRNCKSCYLHSAFTTMLFLSNTRLLMMMMMMIIVIIIIKQY
ncbi:orphan G-protein coupled receptor 30 [Elysia marginata]|uniref:Orphan G-protein coupled receptor 30 n=1 Tax=Elysia marginata TaxID=1093978 RepID=A0AAV4GEU9_9GAST|nr:orphan G-protein coupled receptor 30 [Elysia marginata]